MVGLSGKVRLRCGPLTPSPRTMPERICGAAEGRLSNIDSMRPPSRSCVEACAPRYGTWTIDAAGGLQKLAGQMVQRADAAGAVVQLARLGFRQCDIFGQRFH